MENLREPVMVLAVDLGASSGRVMLAVFNGETIELKEIHRFANEPVLVLDTLYWDVLRLFHEIKQGIHKSLQFGTAAGIAVDTWGVDFGLLDDQGKLLENPVHYRDKRTSGFMNEALTGIDIEELYRITGTQFMEINTIVQLKVLKRDRPDLLEQAKTILMMPDLFHYFLCGVKAAEESIASTTQLYDLKLRKWSEKVLGSIPLKESLLPPVTSSGRIIGTLSGAVCEELNMPAGIPPIQVIAAAGHDTQSALAAVPAGSDDFLFLSCGTWSLLGTELEEPVTNPQARACNMTNEASPGGKTAFLKNITGLWLLQESRRQWKREGKDFGFAELEGMAQAVRPFQSLIDPDNPLFASPGDIPGRIRDYCRKTGQQVPEREGEVVRCIYESLALKYRDAVEEIRQCTGRDYYELYLVGGGSQSQLLCEMTAGACGCRVLAGPVEATVLGNAAVQLIALGYIKDIRQAREVIRNSFALREFQPEQRDRWKKAYQNFKEIIKC